jgi:hypothetical protein
MSKDFGLGHREEVPVQQVFPEDNVVKKTMCEERKVLFESTRVFRIVKRRQRGSEALE